MALNGLLHVESQVFPERVQTDSVRVGNRPRGAVLCKELLRGPLRHLVARALRENRRDEDRERILGLRDDFREGGLPLMQVPRREVAPGEVPHDEADSVTGGY